MNKTSPLAELNGIQSCNNKNVVIEKYYLPLLLLILMGYIVLQSVFIAVFPITHNEGVNLLVSRFINKGYQPYTQIFTLAQPLFIKMIGWIGNIELSVAGFKFVFMLFGLLLLVNVAIIAQQLLGKPEALAATLLLTTVTTFSAEAAGIQAFIPATSIATFSVVLVLKYSISANRLLWLVLAGIVWSIALLISISAISTGLFILLLIGLCNTTSGENKSIQFNWPATAKYAGVWLASAILCGAIATIFFSPKILFNTLFINHLTIWQNTPLDQAHNFTIVGQFLTFNLWLSLFAVYAVARLYYKPNHLLWLMVIWFVFGFVWLMAQVNLFLANTAILLPPLSIMAGWGVVDLIQHIHTKQGSFLNNRYIQTGIVILLVGIFILVSWQRLNEFTLRDVDTLDDLLQFQQRKEIAALIQQHSAPDDCVIIDDAALAIAANRLPIPQLSSIPMERVLSGMLNTSQLAEYIQTEGCNTIVLSNRDYYEYLDGLGDWLNSNYPNTDKYLRTRIYYR